MGDRPEPGGITFDQWMRAVRDYNTAAAAQRPPCPSCGSSHITSHSHRWCCGDCGREFAKVAHPKHEPDRTGRPMCPECGGHMNSNGKCWICRECGKQMSKRR